MNQNENNTLSVLLNIAKQGQTTVSSLMREYECSRAQIKYRMKRIDAFLKDKGLHPLTTKGEIVVVPFSYNDLEKKLNSQKSKDIINDLNTELRKAIESALIFCSSEELSLFHFQSTLKISKNTAINDLKMIKQAVAKFDVMLEYSRQKGYYFSGKGEAIRSYLLHTFTRVENMEAFIKVLQNSINKSNFTQSQSIVEKLFVTMLNMNGIRLRQEYLQPVSWLVTMIVLHMQSEKYTQPHLKEPFSKKGLAYAIARECRKVLEQEFSIEIQTNETRYLTLLIVFLSQSNEMVEEIIGKRSVFFENIALEFISRFSTIMRVELQHLDVRAVALGQHLQSAYFRNTYRLPIINPYLLQIKKNYYDLFYIVKMLMQSFPMPVEFHFGDEEIGFITMHLLQLLDIQDKAPWITNIIVLNEGEEAAEALNVLARYFPEMRLKQSSSQQLEYIDADSYELILAMQPAGQCSKPVVNLTLEDITDEFAVRQKVYEALYAQQPLDNETERIEEILKKIAVYCDIRDESGLKNVLCNLTPLELKVASRIFEQPGLKKVLKTEYIQFAESCNNWKDAIRLAAQPLLNNNCILSAYVDDMIDLAEQHGSYYAVYPRIAMPHAYSDNVRKICISILHLQEPVYLLDHSDLPIQVIIVVGALDNKLHRKALGDLANILASDRKRQQILEAQTGVEIERILFGTV